MSQLTLLEQFGATVSLFEEAKQLDLSLGRISSQYNHLYDVQTATEIVKAQLVGKTAFQANDTCDFPVVGDWVLIDNLENDQAIYFIQKILNRKSLLKRKASGTSQDSQAMVANVDIAFLCMSLNRDFNLRRLERYLTTVCDGGAQPYIILTKADLVDNLDEYLGEVKRLAPSVDVLVSSIENNQIIKTISQLILPHKTAVLLGSSGVGKSTMINRLMGQEIMETKSIRQDGKGRHTTTTRQLFQVPTGGLIIDTPGLRELHIDASQLSETFDDIEDLRVQCKYRNCTHQNEPGCAIVNALETGELSYQRWNGFLKIQKEVNYSQLKAKEIEQQKISNMFGGKKQYKKMMKHIKKKKNR